MKKSNKKLFLLIGILGTVILFFIVLYFSVPKFISSEVAKKKVNAYFFEKTGGSLASQQSDIHLFPLPHIVLRQVSISIPDKATGLVQSIDIYPDLWSLIRGDVKFSRLSFESPRFTLAISEKMGKTSLEEIEEKMRSFVHVLNSLAPALLMTVQEGKLDLTKADHVAFSFDTIQSKLSTSGKSLNISLTCTSSLWDTLSLNSSLRAENLQSSGTVQMKNFRPHALLLQLFPEIGKHAGNSGADFSVKFHALGLREIRAEAESSIPNMVFIRGKNQVEIKGLNLKGAIEIDPGRVSVILSEFNGTLPELKMSGKYILDRTSGITDIDVEGKAIDVQSARTSALALGGDIPVIRSIFDIVLGGRIPVLHFHTGGKSPDNLGQLENIQISGNIFGGDIYIRAKDLHFQNVTGDVVVAKGILEAKNVEAAIENHRGSKGMVRIGLKGRDAPFHLDMWVKADAGQLPSFLRQKHLIANEAVLREMDRLSDTHGSVLGKLILGDRLDAIHAVVDVSNIDLTTRYEPLPFPLMIAGGQVFFDEKRIKITNMNASLGSSSFNNVTAGISLDDKADFEISDGQMKLSADELYPWITSSEKMKPVLREVPSIQGAIAVSSVSLKGPLYHPKDWQYLVNGELNKVAIDSAFFPGKAEESSGTFRITHDELFLKDMRTRMLDGLFTVSGTVTEFPSNIRKLDLSLQGEAGPKVTAWMSGLVKLSPEMFLRAPLSITASHLVWDKEAKADFDGRLVFGRETQVSLRLTKTPDVLSVHEMSVKDRESNVTASIVLSKKTIDSTFKGILTSQTLQTIFAQNTFSGSSLRGDFRSHIILNDPKQSVAEGAIEGKNIPVPWKYDIPLVVQSISLESRGKNIFVDSSQFSIGENQFSVKGVLDNSQALFSVDMDLSSDGFDWETIEKIDGKTKKAEGNTQTISFEDIPLKGSLRMQLGYLKYRQFRWEPFHADVSFEGKTVHVRSEKAALCGISTTGDVEITAQGAELTVTLAAKNLELEPTILCISDKRVDITGKFDMKADIKAKGKLDTIAKSLNGSFTVSSEKGKIYKSQALDETLDLVNKTENVKGTLPDLDKTKIDYRTFTANGTIKEYMVNVEQATLDALSFGILAQGQVDLYNETIDLNALVAPVNFAQGIVGKIPVLGKILGGSLVSIPVKISGKLSDPEVTFLSPSAIGSAFIGIMERTIKLPITIIEPVLPGKPQQ